MNPHYFPNKKWNQYKKWEDAAYIFFDRMEFHMSSFAPMNFRPNSTGHDIISLTTTHRF